MSGTVNKVILVGNLGADPETNKTRDGRPVVTLSIATSDTWRDKNSGERKEKTEWHRVVIFTEGLCKIAEQYLKKGMKVYVEGKLRTIKWTDQAGKDRYTTQINVENFDGTLQMITSGGGAGGRPIEGANDDPSRPGVASRGASPSRAGGDDMNDDIPF